MARIAVLEGYQPRYNYPVELLGEPYESFLGGRKQRQARRAARRERRAARGGSRLGVMIRGSKTGKARRETRRAARGGSRVGKALRSGVGKATIMAAATAASAVTGCPAIGTAAGMGINKLIDATGRKYSTIVTTASLPDNIATQQAEWFEDQVTPEAAPEGKKTGLGVPLAIGGGLAALAFLL